MKNLFLESLVTIPDNVIVTIKKKIIRVKGRFGSLEKKFYNNDILILLQKKDNIIKIHSYYNTGDKPAMVRTIASFIYNMILGVTNGFIFKMRVVYSHFPIIVKGNLDTNSLDIRNYFGQKKINLFYFPNRISFDLSLIQDKRIILKSKCLNSLSLSCNSIQHYFRINNKDTRVFIDGIFISEKSSGHQ
ncbi:60S ribosomal protein L9 (nucleomorph) [Lotharella oceanica]|uniref:60S ribosomal protein L9 n=1 Tax=Lotharella oceanica TaxID=641309 RepID=A0A060DH59_9EUKA|nr:60S ribosomal protein L9 [Lotharella oceanica]|mmetsp:Transcript_4220/g.8188  ORF Transcript_4220/g.8188 Transcript_4220/m.8188 type:complete len:189 (-) Transcript_4220:1762-2328(-)